MCTYIYICIYINPATRIGQLTCICAGSRGANAGPAVPGRDGWPRYLIYIYICIYLYISISKCISLYMYIYIYICTSVEMYFDMSISVCTCFYVFA